MGNGLFYKHVGVRYDVNKSKLKKQEIYIYTVNINIYIYIHIPGFCLSSILVVEASKTRSLPIKTRGPISGTRVCFLSHGSPGV